MEKSEAGLGYKTMFQHGTAVNPQRHDSPPKPAGRASREHLSEKQPVDTQEPHIVTAQVGESIDATTSWKSDPKKSMMLEYFKITMPSWSMRHKISHVDRPPQRSDLNPIESLCDVREKALHSGRTPLSSIHFFENLIQR